MCELVRGCACVCVCVYEWTLAFWEECGLEGKNRCFVILHIAPRVFLIRTDVVAAERAQQKTTTKAQKLRRNDEHTGPGKMNDSILSALNRDSEHGAKRGDENGTRRTSPLSVQRL